MTKSNDLCILFEAIGDERKFCLPMLRQLKERDGARVVGLVRFAQDCKPMMDTGLFEAVYSTSAMIDDLPPDDPSVMDSAREIEERVGSPFHYNLCDRRLYFTGCTSFPYTRVETGEPYSGWVRQFVAIYRGVDEIMERHGVTLSVNGRRVVCDLSRSRGIPVRNLGYSFLHDRMIWRDGMKVNGAWLRQAHEQARSDGRRISAEILQPPPFHMQVRRNVFDNIKLPALIKTIGMLLLRTAYWHVRRYDKVTKYGFSVRRHIRFHLQRRSVYRHLVRNSTRADALIASGRPYVFMALQMEPEVLLSGQTPEFYDQIAMIHQVAKELPVGTYLAVKDHVPALGYRDMSFYRMLETMPNVVMLDPTDYAIPLIRNSKAVVSLLGRSAFEAAAFGIPVLAYSPSVFFGYLPHVRVCSDMARVREELHTILGWTAEERESFGEEGELLLAAMHATTLDPADYESKEAVGAALLASLEASLSAEPAGDGGLRPAPEAAVSTA